jgi:hypothetical protein
MPAPADGAGGGSGILVCLDVLLGENPATPRPLAEAAVALERLELIGEPIVLVGSDIGGTRLDPDPRERTAWARRLLGRPDLRVAAFDEPDVDRGGGVTDHRATERWRQLRTAFRADRLVTRRAAGVGAARRAGLEVVRIGPRVFDTAAMIERPNHEARDLLHAVSRLLVADTFPSLA